jgi:ADP-heptose:LPS heptosyltransferase
LIFPTTNRKVKDYTTRGFLAIAKGLRARGLHPEIIVAPNERAALGKIFSPNGYSVKSFETLEQLARHIYESGAVLSNDSGGGHFASLLDIPSVVIHKKYNNFEWRPGWKKPLIARPKVRLKLLGKRIWKPFISHAEIINFIVNNTN